MDKINILHLEDSDADAELVNVSLFAEFPDASVTRVTSRQQFEEKLHSQEFHLILADYNLPGFNGMEALKITRGVLPDLPFIFLSGTIGEELAVEALRLGATDYVLKSRIDKLPFVIIRALREQQHNQEWELNRQRIYDAHQLLESVFNNTHIQVAYLDANLHFLKVNRAYAVAEDKSPEYFMGKYHFDVFPDEKNEEIFWQVIKSGKAHYAQAQPFTYNHTKKGTTYWDWSLVPTSNKEGEINGLVVTLLDVTQRVQSEHALKGSEQRFRELAETIKEVFWLTDWKTKKTLYVSPAYEEIYGYSVKSLMEDNSSWLNHIHEDDRDYVTSEFISKAETGEYSVEFRVLHPNKNIRWVHEQAFPIKEGNTVVRMAGYSVDITDRKQAQQNLQFTTDILNRVSSLVVVINKKGAYIYVSPSSLSMLNFSPEELLGYKWWLKTTFDTEQQEVERNRMMRMVKEGLRKEDKYYENVVKTKDGGLKWISWDFTETSDGLLIGVGQDISLRKAAEKQLSASEYRYTHLFEQMSDGILFTDTSGVIVMCNQSFCRITGYDAHELSGKDTYDLLVFGDDKEKARKKVKDRKAVNTDPYELRFVRKDGKTIWVRINLSPSINEDMKFIGVMLMVSDITDVKEAELKLLHEKKQALQFQSMLLSSQISPHFIFNALNSIQYYILENKTEPALEFVAEFSRLMRTTLENSLNKHIALSAEIDFLKQYLDLEKKRYSDKFEYEITVADEIEEGDYFIPPMILQPYIENTVVHGLSSLETQGKVTIHFEIKKEDLICTICDNGIGRKRAMELRELRVGKSRHRSLGMNILETRFNLLNELTGKKYQVIIKDLENAEGAPAGTLIMVQIPVITENALTPVKQK